MYRVDDLLTEVIDAQGNTTQYAYDDLSRLTARRDPDRGDFYFSYDRASNLVESVDAMGQRISQTYDGLNRIRTEDFHDEAEAWSAQRSYDPSQPIGAENQPDVTYYYDTPFGKWISAMGLLA